MQYLSTIVYVSDICTLAVVLGTTGYINALSEMTCLFRICLIIPHEQRLQARGCFKLEA